jgi:hypothetical protein
MLDEEALFYAETIDVMILEMKSTSVLSASGHVTMAKRTSSQASITLRGTTLGILNIIIQDDCNFAIDNAVCLPHPKIGLLVSILTHPFGSL